ncbi:uncharacterized protein LOC127522908 isoform X10 [Ctenopharyngodon idella]|uniref:uncharacterized protein LOC127522908 isoform X10 n=1 Tax=Ctenopharyngodon idella TaxID=7959 RepID=UPI00222F47EB|nr:uncharacterized protein LOC127522908 isoform X10 [Ctenopharyngodon idella]
MSWTKCILLFTMTVMTLISSLRAGPEAFSETGAVSGVVSENTIRFGKLLIGAQGTVSGKEIRASALKSAEQFDEYQSKEGRFHLAKTKLHRLGPSVRCGNDSMTLHIPGAIRTPHFLVDRGDQSTVPLSEMPASCGFSLKRARRDVSLVAPYQGCHVKQQGGSYILPLLIMGAPVQMSCPVSPRLPTVSCFPSSMTISLGVRVDDVQVKVDGSWQPLLLTYSKCSFTLATVDGSLVVTAPFTGSCWEVKDTEMQLPLMYGDREVTLSCPVTPPTPAPTTIAPTAAPVQDPLDSQQQMFYPFPFGRPWWYPHSPGHPVPPTVPPTTTTTTTTPPPVQDPYQHVFPHTYPMSMFDPYFHSSGSVAHWPRYPMFPPYMYHFRSPVEATTPATTTPSTTTAAQFEQFAGYPPMYQMYYGPQPFKSFVPPGVKYPFMP